MEFVTKGVVLAEHQTVDSQRILYLYTEDRGFVTAFAKSAKGMKNKFYAGLQLFQHCEFTLYEKNNMTYIIKDVEVLHSFFRICEHVETLTLAAYCCDIIRYLSPNAEDAELHLPFFLNTLHLIGKKERDLRLIKITFELRTMALNGYMPDLVACANCSEYKEEPHYFDRQDGYILCFECANSMNKSVNVTTSGIAMLRHILYSDDKNVFSFRYNCSADTGIFRLVESFVLWNIDKYPASLDMFNKVMIDRQFHEIGEKTKEDE